MKLLLLGFLSFASFSSYSDSGCRLLEVSLDSRFENVLSGKFKLTPFDFSDNYDFRIVKTTSSCDYYEAPGTLGDHFDIAYKACIARVYVENKETGLVRIIQGERGANKTRAIKKAYRAIPNCLEGEW